MRRLLRYILLFALLFVAVGIISAQEEDAIRGYHKVKRKETIFGISRMYDITIEELIAANPVMKGADYDLKKGDILRIPYPKSDSSFWHSLGRRCEESHHPLGCDAALA